jgi:hypothetical protein
MCEGTIQERGFETRFWSEGDGVRDVWLSIDLSLPCSPSQHLTI